MIEQRTEGWREQRAGRITASCFADAIAMNKRQPDKSTETREKYKRTLVDEILSGMPKHEISSKSLSWGTEAEEHARTAYELATGHMVEQSEFVTHCQYDFIGCSPDGLIAEDGGIEMKCPYDGQVHICTWLEGMPADHIAQVQGCMMVTGRRWWDFISYDPRQREPYRLYVQRIERDNEYIEKTLLPGLLKFWAEVQEMLAKIRSKAA